MIHSEMISFFLAGEPQAISPDSPFWDLHLPGKDQSFGSATIGQYLLAAKEFLTTPENQALPHALAALKGPLFKISGLDISLEKHGAFYHPLKITVKSNPLQACTLVLNGAVDRPGLDLIAREYQLLTRLNTDSGPHCLPKVFGAGTQKSIQLETAFFLGEWLEGFYEFHITQNHGKECLVIWGPGKTTRYLSYEQAAPIYEQAAWILTAYYNPATGASIFPWHHAAGDFVVNPEDPNLPVRLITVRGFSPLAEMEQENSCLVSLLFFFLGTLLRMRLDRLDGTGAMVFLKEPVARAAINGFFNALSQPVLGAATDTQSRPPDLAHHFHDFILSFTPNQLESITAHMVKAWQSPARETKLIRKHLHTHIGQVTHILKTGGSCQ